MPQRQHLQDGRSGLIPFEIPARSGVEPDEQVEAPSGTVAELDDPIRVPDRGVRRRERRQAAL